MLSPVFSKALPTALPGLPRMDSVEFLRVRKGLYVHGKIYVKGSLRIRFFEQVKVKMGTDYDLMSTPGALMRRAQQLHSTYWFELMGTQFTSAQYAVLTAAARKPNIDQTQLSRESSLDTSTVQAVVVRLVQKGMLSRHRSKTDGRRWLVRLTDDGIEAMESVMAKVLQIQDLLLAPLLEDERVEFTRMLLKIVEEGERKRRALEPN